MAMYINTIRANGRTFGVSIPPSLLRAVAWNKGDTVILEVGPDNTIIIHAEKKLQEWLRARAAKRARQHGTPKQSN